MDQIQLAILQLLQNFLDEKAKTEAERFLSDFIVGSRPYNEGLGYVAINKIDADLVCRGELPICQPLRDFLAVCEAKDFLGKNLMSGNVVCTGLTPSIGTGKTVHLPVCYTTLAHCRSADKNSIRNRWRGWK